MSQTKKQLKNEITKLYNVFLRSKFMQWVDKEYKNTLTEHINTFTINDFRINFYSMYICFSFKDYLHFLHIDYTGEITDEYRGSYTVDELREAYKLLKKLVVSMI
jgi:hypothetical protein